MTIFVFPIKFLFLAILNFMLWLKTLPWLSLAIIIVTYGVFGWHIATLSAHWSHALVLQSRDWGLSIEDNSMMLIIHLLAILMIVITSLALSAPLSLMTFVVGSSIRSEGQSIVSMVIWSFLFVIILRWFNIFTHFLVLLSAALLGRLELRYIGYTNTRTVFLLMLIGLVGFSIGALSYLYWFNPTILMRPERG